MRTPEELTEQVVTVIRMLTGKRLTQDSVMFKTCLQWISHFPGTVNAKHKRQLLHAMTQAFGISERDIYLIISGEELPLLGPGEDRSEEELLAKLPKGGWLENYYHYTKFTEAPLSYHIFSSLVALGACFGRRLWHSHGHFVTYPNMRVILIGPPGRTRKSTAIAIARRLVVKAELCPLFEDKITPESLATSLKESSHQFAEAEELAVLFGRQKYNEGLVETLLKLLNDDDKPVRIRTLSRGVEEIENCSLSILGGTTMSLLTESTSSQVASSGFLSRFICVNEDDTPRCFPAPLKGEIIYENLLLSTLERLKNLEGEITFSSQADEWFRNWYSQRWKKVRQYDSETLAQILERTPTHLERIATNLHLADHKTKEICLECMQMAEVLVNYSERHIPRIVSAVNQSNRPDDAEYVLVRLRRSGGVCDHSHLLRAVADRGITADMFRRHISTLVERGQVRKEFRGALQYYFLEQEEPQPLSQKPETDAG